MVRGNNSFRWYLGVNTVLAQHSNQPPQRGMLLVGGEWEIPTPESTLRTFMKIDDSEYRQDVEDVIVAVLNQDFRTYT